MRKLGLLLLALVVAAQTAFAASIELPLPKRGDEDIMVLSGNADVSPGEKLTLTVFAAGKDYSDVAVFGEPTDVIAFAGITQALEDGSFSLEWTPQASGTYDLYLAGGSSFITALKGVYVPAGAAVLYQAVQTGSRAELIELFSDDENRRALLRQEELYGNISKPEELGEAVYHLRSALTDTADPDAYMEAAALLQVLSEQKTLAALDRAVVALSEIGLALTQEDAIQAYGTDAIRTDLAADLGGISTKPFDELDAYVTERLILSGVYKSSNWMDGLEFLNLLAYPAAGAAREKAAKAVTGTKYNSETALKAAIDAALRPSNTGGGTGGSTGSAGGGTGGFSAPDTGLAVDVGETPSTGEMDDIFPDVDRSHYAFDDINYLRWHDVVAGDDTGYFNPDRAVTRAEAVKMLCRVFGVESAEEYAFGDVQSGSWYYGFVGGAYKNGLVLGGSDGLFNPDAFITREDLAVLIWRFAAFAGSPFPEGGMQFTDSGSVSGYALEAVGALTAGGIIRGMEDGSFAPQANADRAQTASMLARYMRGVERSG